jgi:hypothetical protein
MTSPGAEQPAVPRFPAPWIMDLELCRRPLPGNVDPELLRQPPGSGQSLRATAVAVILASAE